MIVREGNIQNVRFNPWNEWMQYKHVEVMLFISTQIYHFGYESNAQTTMHTSLVDFIFYLQFSTQFYHHSPRHKSFSCFRNVNNLITLTRCRDTQRRVRANMDWQMFNMHLFIVHDRSLPWETFANVMNWKDLKWWLYELRLARQCNEWTMSRHIWCDQVW